MYMKFIGKDGSMGLKHGKTYSVRIESRYPYIWVVWGAGKACPYDSMYGLRANWKEVIL